MLLTEAPEAILVLGRGIGKDSHGQWHPTGYFETFQNNQRTGTLDVYPDPNNPNTVIGGGYCNTLASYHLYRQLYLQGNPPGLIIFAAGRPNYLAAEPPGIAEGTVMRKKVFQRLVREDTPLPETRVLTGNKNTKDDIDESLKIFGERGLSRVVATTIEVHTERTAEFIRLARSAQPELSIDLNLIPAESILVDLNPTLEDFFEYARQTPAYLKTQEMEQDGIKAIREGRYNFSHQGYAFAKNPTR